MQQFPHHYKVLAAASPDGEVDLECEGLDAIASAPPAEFGGPGDRWSPETLLAASVADCFVLSFRAIARGSKLTWTSLNCEVEGVLEREAGATKFTRFLVRATLNVPQDTNEERALRILEKAEETCLITNSLSSEILLETDVCKTSGA